MVDIVDDVPGDENRGEISPNQVRLTPEEGINRARGFFRSQGFATDSDGLLDRRLQPAQLASLKQEREARMARDEGIEMPTEEQFYRTMYEAVSLYPQMKDGQIQYLMGRGAGIEAALRGQIPGRNKNPWNFSYRTHSDLDLYGVDYDVAPDSLENLGGREVYTPEFVEVFGHQEIYPPKATKGLHDMPGDLLHETAETVDLGGIPVVVPQLELLALDKWLVAEKTPRPEGFDAVLLGLQYDLDPDLMAEYYERFVATPEKGSIDSVLDKQVERHLDRLSFRQHRLEQQVMEELGVSREEARKKINEGLAEALEDPEKTKAEVERVQVARRNQMDQWIESKGATPRPPDPSVDFLIKTEPEGFDTSLWIPISVSDLAEDGESMSQEYQDQVKAKLKAQEEEKMKRDRTSKVREFFVTVDQARKRLGAHQS